ncbi:MAG TPA: protein kinase [Vicinamibacteria bacterium]|nr:protein kinase [Vicinamibacteria bacterium]
MDESQLETGSAEAHLPGELHRWGPFELTRRVGHGSFGEVYRAFDPTLRRHVALKLLLPRGLDPEAEARSLVDEARAMARIRHPNVVPIFGVDQHEGRVGFWSDFVQGTTLSELVDRQGPLGPREAALVGIDVCRAVGAVHATGLVHRDIKAGNVMREEGGRILLMDFGLAHRSGSLIQPSGTPAYMAPELLGGEPATVASDVYAIGVLLFNMLTARYPVEAADLGSLRAAHAASSRRILLDVRPDLPPALAQVVEKAAHPDPGQRFASAGQLAAALSEAIGMGTAAAPARTRSWGHGAVVLAAAVAAAAALWLALPRVRAVLEAEPAKTSPSLALQAEYRRARDLLAHYYRPRALETAIPLLETVAARDPRLAPAFADLARANFLQFTQQRETRYLEPARRAALQALALRPDLVSAHVTLGSLYAWTAQYDLASHELQEAQRLDRFDAATYGALADLYRRQGRSELVEPTLRQAVTLSPGDWNLIQQLGEHYLDSGRWDLAEQQYQRAAELLPDNPRPQNNLGLAYQGQGRLEEAAAAFRKAIDLEPSFIHYRNLGEVLAEAGRYQEAERMLERSIEMQPANYRAWGLLGGVRRNLGQDPAKVKETYLKAIALAAEPLKETPRDEYLLADVGSYYAAAAMEKEALPLLAQAAALAPDVPQVLYQVALGYESLHHREEALHWLARAQSIGYPSTTISRDPDLAALRADPRYRAAAGEAAGNNRAGGR